MNFTRNQTRKNGLPSLSLELFALTLACSITLWSMPGCSKDADDGDHADHAHAAADDGHDHMHDAATDHDADPAHDHDGAGHPDDDSGAHVHNPVDAHTGSDVNPIDPDFMPDVYVGILGEIKEIPVAGDPSSSLKIHHMQIPDFKTKDGTVNVNAQGISGMRSMTMPFPLAQGVSIEGFEVGDKIKFTFEVDWSGQSTNPWQVTKIEKLPADTVIDFTNKVAEPDDEAP
ncbi:MAG: copper-binding protein [Phycisphaerales bacterium]